MQNGTTLPFVFLQVNEYSSKCTINALYLYNNSQKLLISIVKKSKNKNAGKIMRKIMLTASIIMGLCMPTTSHCDFVNKKKPYDGKSMGIVGAIIAVTNYIWFLKASTSHLYKTTIHTNGDFYYRARPKNPVALFYSSIFFGCGLLLTCANIVERYKFIQWNNRTDEQVYQDAQATHEHISSQLGPLYAITGKTIDPAAPFDVTQRMITGIQELGASLDGIPRRAARLPLRNMLHFLDSIRSLLDDHLKALQERIHAGKNKETLYVLSAEHADSAILPEWAELISHYTQEIQSIDAIKAFIYQSLEYQVESLIMANGH